MMRALCRWRAPFNGAALAAPRHARRFRPFSTDFGLPLRDSREDRKVLVIYCGGTIGMARQDGKRVLAPQRGLLSRLLQQSPKFHDSTVTPPSESGGTMPLSQWGRRVTWVMHETETLLDSSNMDQTDWLNIAKLIYANYNSGYDGFVLIQGTDTLTYTSSCLSFILRYLSKTVVITGSQVPMIIQPNDAEANLFGAINIAAHFEIPEVCVFFNGVLMRGNRTTKFDASSYEAFVSHNYAPLGFFHAEVSINWALVRSAADVEHRLFPFRIATHLSANVAVLRMFPGIGESFIRKCLEPPLRGCVLTTYGQGNINLRCGFIADAIRQASERGVLFVNVTQCPRGAVTQSYESGHLLLELGVQPGHDMTVESAVTKLAFLLGQVEAGEMTLDDARSKISTSLRGELTAPVSVRQFSFRDGNFVAALVQSMEKVVASTQQTAAIGPRSDIANALFSIVSQFGDVPSLEAVLRSGADVNCVDAEGRTALHLAAAKNRIDVATFLIDVAQCDLNVLDSTATPGLVTGLTALDHAIIRGHTDMIALLRQRGAKQAFMLGPQRK